MTGVAPPELRHVWHDVCGVRMHSLRSTVALPPDAPTVVLVHGLALSGRYMIPTGRCLAPHAHVHLPDLPGFGDSADPGRILDVPGLAAALGDWMAAARLPPAVLVGNSFGCQIIIDLAARRPQGVEGAVLQGPTTPPEDRTWLRQYVVWRRNAPYNPPEMGEIAWADYRKCGYVRALWTFHLGLIDRPEDKLPHVRCPALVVRGQRDPICPDHWVERVAQALPDGRLAVIPEVAHTLCFTAPEQMAWLTRVFAAEVL
jgi:2-hydroxy-6-oxonona-2,4-dienedioate hydrolase